jgi:hypothetical protein
LGYFEQEYLYYTKQYFAEGENVGTKYMGRRWHSIYGRSKFIYVYFHIIQFKSKQLFALSQSLYTDRFYIRILNEFDFNTN